MQDILDKLKHYPPESELKIQGIENPAMFYEDGTYVLKDFKDEND